MHQLADVDQRHGPLRVGEAGLPLDKARKTVLVFLH